MFKFHLRQKINNLDAYKGFTSSQNTNSDQAYASVIEHI